MPAATSGATHLVAFCGGMERHAYPPLHAQCGKWKYITHAISQEEIEAIVVSLSQMSPRFTLVRIGLQL